MVLAERGGAARAQPADTDHSGRRGSAASACTRIDSKVRLARVCRMAEGGRRRKTVAHGDDPPPPPPPAVVWMYFKLVPILHGQRLAGMCVNKLCEYTDM